MTHARDQWFQIYVYTDWTPKIEVRVSEPTLADPKPEPRPVIVGMNPPTWEPSGIFHVHHVDAYHPDLRVRLVHHRAILKTGVALAACGAEQDPRGRFIEAHDPKDRCAECVARTEEAMPVHAAALAELKRKAAEKRAEMLPVDFTLEEPPTGH